MTSQQQYDPFDVRNLSDDEAFSDVAAVETTLTIPVKKPGKQQFFRVNPDPAMTMVTRVLAYTADGDLSPTLYWLDRRNMDVAMIGDSIQVKKVFVCMYRSGGIFVWPASLPDPNARGGSDRWANSALKAAGLAQQEWVRMIPEPANIGGYKVLIARGEYPDPVWPPDLTLPDVLRLAFADHLIDSMDHPVVRDLLGE